MVLMLERKCITTQQYNAQLTLRSLTPTEPLIQGAGQQIDHMVVYSVSHVLCKLWH